MIRLELPYPLRMLAKLEGETQLDVPAPTTLRAVVAALEARHPTLRGTLIDPATQRRRPLVRFYACERDLSHQSLDAPLPDAVTSGAEPLLVIGAIAGG